MACGCGCNSCDKKDNTPVRKVASGRQKLVRLYKQDSNAVLTAAKKLFNNLNLNQNQNGY